MMTSSDLRTQADGIRWNPVYRSLTEKALSVSGVLNHNRRFWAEDEVSGVWPSRLLHIESMRSYPRMEGDRYKGVRKPLYTILSYKWGYWVVKGQHSDLGIKGIDWPMPAIDPNYFSVKEMTQLLKKMRKYAEFAWIDVACVNQLLNDLTLQEIIVEPRNFRLAKMAFAWWVDFNSDLLDRLLNDISDLQVELTKLSSNPNREDDLQHIPCILMHGLDSFLVVIGIPWFASNWTLREIVLCQSIVILNREGDTIPLRGRGNKPATVDMIAKVCIMMLAWLKRVEAYSKDVELQKRQISLSKQGLMPSSLNKDDQTVAVATLVERFLALVDERGPFFLYATAPDVLYHWTMVLLRTGRLVLEHQAGEEMHEESCKAMQYGGWGRGMYLDCSCLTACGCEGSVARHDESMCPKMKEMLGPDSKICIPCLLGISYPLSENTAITVHTKISRDHKEVGTPLKRTTWDIRGKPELIQTAPVLNKVRAYLNAV